MYRAALCKLQKKVWFQPGRSFIKPSTSTVSYLNKCHSTFSFNLKNSVLNYNFFGCMFYHHSCALWKSKGKKTGSKLKQVIRAVDAAEVVDLDKVQEDMKSLVNDLKNDYAIDYRVGSDLPLDQIEVVIEGDTYTLNEVAQISKLSPYLVQIDMIDFPELVDTVKNAICATKWNLNPSVAGTIIKVPIPQVNAERRTMIAKAAKQRLGMCKQDLRNHVSNVYQSFRKHEKLTEDFEYLLKQQITIYLDHFLEEAESLYKGKEKEVLQPS